ncbi:hypothetical protein [Dyadobacter sp. OTU695]|uniref:hypothetical protein n=1 Tax=Dyadobacter sp. OTU695 TaxID=3043860 RepID=UPI00313D02EB
MKYSTFLLFAFLINACWHEQLPTQREPNFNIILSSTDDYGDSVNLIEGSVGYPRRMDVGFVAISLTEAEWQEVFQSVPWNSLNDIPNYYEPHGQHLFAPDNYDEITFINGKLRKTVMLKSWDKFADNPELVEQLRDCVDLVHQTVRRKADIQPLKRFECGLGI